MNFETHLSQKEAFKFNELTSVVGVKPYVLRFWESEFEQIMPSVDSGGEKLYSSEDLKRIKRIKELLFDDKLSIPQAKNVLDQELEEAKEVSENIQLANNMIHLNEESIITEGIVSSKHSSLDLMKKALEKDFEQAQSLQKLSIDRQISDKDIVHLVQAKKKLTNVLSKMNELIEGRSW